MEYYDNRLCVSARELVDGGVMSEPNYKQLAARRRMDVVRRGGNGRVALVAVDSLPERYRSAVCGDDGGSEGRLRAWARENYEVDQKAVAFFFDRESAGVALPEEKAREYVTNASVLNCCIRLYRRASTAQRLFGGKYDWGQMAPVVEALRAEYGHTLPSSALRFRRRVNDYEREGYASLVSGKFGNQSARKVSAHVERLIVSIACLPNRPWNTSVLEMYNSFVTGELDVYDPETGELYDPARFTDKDGEPLVLSEKTVVNYLNSPKNRLFVARATEGFTTFMHEQMPHMHRHAGEFSLSKVTMDDRDLPRKLRDTKLRPKAYYAYDVTSGACIGAAYSRMKTVDLVSEMFRDMFRLLDRHGWGCPAEVEVENHLMSQWRESFLRAGVLFPFVRFCAPMNSQEKSAEAFNGAKKRQVEHRNHTGIGRFYAKSPKYRTEARKVFDERNDTYEEREYYTWEELVADDRRDIAEYNAAPHSNQKKYPGMSRWDVLVANINPELRPLDKATIARYVGVRVPTSVRRHSYCRVCGRDWWLSRTEAIELLAPNNYKVDAYYLTDEGGDITDMYIYQGDALIDRLEDVGTYCTASAEQTEEDVRVFVEQRKKLSHFTGYVSRNEVPAVRVAARSAAPSEEPGENDGAAACGAAEAAAPPTCAPPLPFMSQAEEEDFSARALNDI